MKSKCIKYQLCIFLIFLQFNLLGQSKKDYGNEFNWYLKSYSDSTILNKQIYKYSGSCASYAYKIEIDESKMDSIIFIGYHETWKDKISRISDNVYKMGDESQYWRITLDSSLIIQEFFRDNDTTGFVFERRKDLPLLQKYFSEEIFVGKYLNEKTDELVSFKPDSVVTGIENYSKYELIIDFWDFGNGMDGIYLYDEGGKMEEFHWWFKDEYLYLKRIQGAYETDDGWKDAELVGETIILKMIQ